MNQLSFYKAPKHFVKDPTKVLKLRPFASRSEPTLMNGYQEYRGLYYKYDATTDTWKVSDHPNEMGHLWLFDGATHRIDQCLEIAAQSYHESILRNQMLAYEKLT